MWLYPYFIPEASQNVTSNETCNVVHENSNIASDHFEANPTELQNQKLSTEPDASGNKPSYIY